MVVGLYHNIVRVFATSKVSMTFNFIGIYTKISSAIAYIVMFENIYSLAIDKMEKF
jgi:hypothetical protein